MPRKSVYEAATLGSRLDVLTAMRDVVAKALDSVDLKPADLAPLSRRQMEIIDEIEQIQKGSNEDVIGTAVSTPDEKWNAQ